MVDDGDHEDRPRGPATARARDGPQRVRRLRRGGGQRARDRLDRGALRPAAASRSIWASPSSLLGLVLSVLARARDARTTSRTNRGSSTRDAASGAPSHARGLLAHDAARIANLSSVSQAGLVNNLNDGMAWGLFPLFFAAARHDPRADRHPRRDLPGDLGHRAARHRRAVRPHRAQVAHRLGHVGPGGRHRA